MFCQPYSTLSKARHVLIAEGLKPKKQWDWLRIRSDCTRQQRQNLRQPNTSSNDPPNTTHKGPSNAFADVCSELLLSNTINHLWIFQVVIIFGITFAIEFAIIPVEAGLASRNIVLSLKEAFCVASALALALIVFWKICLSYRYKFDPTYPVTNRKIAYGCLLKIYFSNERRSCRANQNVTEFFIWDISDKWTRSWYQVEIANIATKTH